jgi:tRNA (guanine37-N1)-methyltransferase
MMRIDIATLFPEMCKAVLSESIIGRALKNNLLQVNYINIRDYTKDKHRRVDDVPYGGGKGMLMQAEPIYNAFKQVCEDIGGVKPYTIFMSPKGSVLNQNKAIELSKLENIFILCGHYEGVDQRIIDKIVDEEISIGDYVLTGGELPAIVLVDSIARMCDGVLSSPECFEKESHFGGLLEHPQYTRPETWEGETVPQVLLSGHHKNIDNWRYEKSLEITRDKRPDMYIKYIEGKT